ncbi:hypothetical protein SeMB42_g06702 [Synchytrium endobioticum]|uniref:Uncharacterized protein n=1 Tax=Synchytrium endobioticum TaxID=286115 RepID=A0A507CNA0_9FUNG|nr:hypothetical protein SeMB42_g06702 [Synchytrium endobioticum]TPX40612.1 hypothetical protein SeLEV6574_g06530 [Synchytrium endobioticum]
MADARRQELERKRQKLLELRKQKDERKIAAAGTATTGVPSIRTSSSSGGLYQDRSNIDDLVSSLIGDTSSSTKSPTVTRLLQQEEFTRRPDSPADSITSKAESAALLQDVSSGLDAREKYVPNLSSVEIFVFDIPPKEKVIYNKQVQTVETAPAEPPQANQPSSPIPLPPPHITQPAVLSATLDQSQQDSKGAPQSSPPELNEDEKQRILSSDHFCRFFEQSTKIVERALTDRYDIMMDYTAGEDVDRNPSTGVKEVCSFFDDKWTKNRAVTSVQWSLKFSELLLGSYNKNISSLNDPDGIVLVWNLHLADRPEFIFNAQSEVTAAMFSDFHQNLIVGGTYTGQIVLWDTRAKSSPVLKTPLSSTGHAHPIYSMSMVGTQNAHNLISASTDGMVCSWQLDMLAQPVEILELLHHSHPKTPEVSVTCMDFTQSDPSTFWVGTEEGNIYQAFRYDRAGSKAGVNQQDIYKGHCGMVTGLHFHPFNDFSDLFLSSSVDWTVKLWRAKSLAKGSASATTISPIYSFENADDHIYDLKWAPHHPALFASVDASGKFHVYDLTQETEVPAVSIAVGGGMALDKLAWDKEGRKTVLGSSDGHLYVYDIGEMSQPRAEDLSCFAKVVSGFEYNPLSVVD